MIYNRCTRPQKKGGKKKKSKSALSAGYYLWYRLREKESYNPVNVNKELYNPAT
jgi:hypothetical protein